MPDQDGQLNEALHTLQRLLSSRRVYAAMVSSAGAELSQQATQALLALEEAPRSVAEVAEIARMDMGAMSRQLRNLEDDGLAHRETRAGSGGVVLVCQTDKGKQLAERILRVRRRHIDEALAAWSTADRATLGHLLLRFVTDLQRTPYRAD